MEIARIGGAKAIKTTIGDRIYFLLFNSMAMFEFHDEFKSVATFYEDCAPKSTANVDILIKGVCILAKYGEIARRALNFEKQDFLKEEILKVTVMPNEINALWQACADAISIGYGREIQDDDEEIDLGLLEMQKKKE